ncbi:hypothetical protein D3H35_17830 [Cohnella faecalis]|uniref:RHS repeat protein n=1 Tax=Cohnella faecalis TaxID=2315694 RepID=A0A398CJR1_9BACL|nr:hypothetical protein D3H35_17830 [Cohnella faecalis]
MAASELHVRQQRQYDRQVVGDYEEDRPGERADANVWHFYLRSDNTNSRIAPVVGSVARYEYDGFNQLVKVSSGSGGSTYEYNGDGLRVKKTTASGTTAYLYEYDKVVLETDGAGKQTAATCTALT